MTTPSALPQISLAALRAHPAGLAYLLTREEGQPYQVPAHLAALSLALARAAMGRCPRLMVSMPPQHGKSNLVSRWFPVWLLDRWPERQVILASYEAGFAAEWGRAVRNAIAEHQAALRVRLSDDSTAADRWRTTAEGGMVTAGVGGPITGRGADILIVDDPVKNDEEARSRTYRDRAWEWWLRVAYTRLRPGAAAVLVMTRWHQDDLAGRILAGAEEPWEVLAFPAIAEEGDPLARPPGTALWPERYPIEDLQRIKREIGSQAFACLYQQHPSPDEGGMVKRNWWRFWREPPQCPWLLQSWDMTFKETTDGSYVVGQVWGVKGADRFLLDQVRARMDFPGAVRAVQTLSAKWPAAMRKLVEDKANGPAVVSTLQHQVAGLLPVQVRGSKEARMAAHTAEIEAGNVYLPDPSIAPWVHDYIEELAAFPLGPYDDQVDATSQALADLATSAADSYVRDPGDRPKRPRLMDRGRLWK
jgi:predicted phage terminase large subunit-like protein